MSREKGEREKARSRDRGDFWDLFRLSLVKSPARTPNAQRVEDGGGGRERGQGGREGNRRDAKNRDGRDGRSVTRETRREGRPAMERCETGVRDWGARLGGYSVGMCPGTPTRLCMLVENGFENTEFPKFEFSGVCSKVT